MKILLSILAASLLSQANGPAQSVYLNAGESVTYLFDSLSPWWGGVSDTEQVAPFYPGTAGFRLMYYGSEYGVRAELFENDVTQAPFATLRATTLIYFGGDFDGGWGDLQGALRITAIGPVQIVEPGLVVRLPNLSDVPAPRTYYSLSLVPEPGTSALFGFAVLSFGLWKILKRNHGPSA